MSYRPENFFQFVRNYRLPFFFSWGLNLAFVGLGVFLFFKVYHDHPQAFWIGIILLLLGFLAQKGFIYGSIYHMYHAGAKAYQSFLPQEVVILRDLKVRVNGYDLSKLKSKSLPRLARPIYDFDRADVLLGPQSLVLLGMSRIFGPVTYAAPVEVSLTQKGQTEVHQVKWIYQEDTRQGLVISFSDPSYTRQISIRFINPPEKLGEWVAKLCAQSITRDQ